MEMACTNALRRMRPTGSVVLTGLHGIQPRRPLAPMPYLLD